MARNRRVFPFFLDGGVQEVSYGASDTTASWDGTSSYVEILTEATSTPTFTIGVTDTYGKPIEHGTILVVRNVQTGGAKTVTVDWSDEFTDGSQGQEVDLIQEGSGVMLLFKSPSSSNKKGEWVNLTSDTDKTDQGADLNVLGDLHVKGALKLSSTSLQTATGNNTATALDVTSNKAVIFVTSTASGQGINLTNPIDDGVVRIVNVSTNDVTVYPDGTDRTTIDDGPSIDVVAGGTLELYFPALSDESSNIIVFNNQA